MTEATPRPFRISGNYIVTDNERWGGSTGEIFVAELQRHRTGASDHIAPDEIQNAYAQLIVTALNTHDDFKQSSVLLREAVAQLAVTQERIVTLEKAADAALTWWHSKPSNINKREPEWVQMCRTAAALCDHRGDCTHIEAKS